MKNRRRLATAIILGAILACVAPTANASSLVCTVPTSVTLDVLPAGCAAVLTNGPITFTGVQGSNGDTHNVEIDSLLMFDMNIAALSAHVSLEGIDHDVTKGMDTPFSRSITNFFETTPDDTAYLADTAPHTFPVAHFINDFGGGVVFKLNFGEAGRPGEASFVTEPDFYLGDIDALLASDVCQRLGKVFLNASMAPSA